MFLILAESCFTSSKPDGSTVTRHTLSPTRHFSHFLWTIYFAILLSMFYYVHLIVISGKFGYNIEIGLTRIKKTHPDETSLVFETASCSKICKTVQNRLKDMQYWERKQKKSSLLQTERTLRSSMMHWKRFMAEIVIEPPHCLAQMEAHFSQIKMVS